MSSSLIKFEGVVSETLWTVLLGNHEMTDLGGTYHRIYVEGFSVKLVHKFSQIK